MKAGMRRGHSMAAALVLAVCGANLMDPTRRAEVLATAQRTTTEFLDLSRAVA